MPHVEILSERPNQHIFLLKGINWVTEFKHWVTDTVNKLFNGMTLNNLKDLTARSITSTHKVSKSCIITFSLQKDKVIEFTKTLMLVNWRICSKLVFLSLPSSCSTDQKYYNNLPCFINTARNFICFILSWPCLLLLYIGLITKSYLIQSINCEIQGLDILSIFW